MYSRELQFIDTQEKAYLLGLFYSDGSVGENQTQCRITLRECDFSLLLHLKQLFPFFYIHSYESKNQFELGNYNQWLKEDLINNGCLPKKSTINRNNLHVPPLDDTLLRHFIRGYFDGDGGCTVSNITSNKKTQKRVYIYSASYYLLKEIQEILSINKIQTCSLPIIDLSENVKVYKLTIKTNSYKTFYDFLYLDSTIYMKRKIDKFTFIINNTNFFIRKPTKKCIFCTSLNTVCNGISYTPIKLQRYLCKDCQKIFTAPLNSNIQSAEGELLED